MCGLGKISLPKAVLEMFGLKSNSEVTLTKVRVGRLYLSLETRPS